MSTDTQAYIPAHVTVEDVKDVLTHILKIEKVAVDYHYSYFCILSFQYNGKQRGMSFFTNTTDCVFPANSISIGQNEDGQHIISTIWNVVGGLYTPNDSVGENYHSKGVLSGDNTAYVMKWAALRGIIGGDKEQDCRAAYKFFDKHMGRQEK
jgi:hypothetical protein